MRAELVIGSDAARAVGRFRPEGALGYRAASLPYAPLRATRAEAVRDERAWLERGESPLSWDAAFADVAV